ncbi:uncharacterized protein METZ01_LOCUS54309 [marine metagenome]|uniref:Uncharacterized protein n=1 Tax=marine metagenome TaxID=408172 RepID=A0A381SBI2_9ZZZZ
MTNQGEPIGQLTPVTQNQRRKGYDSGYLEPAKT